MKTNLTWPPGDFTSLTTQWYPSSPDVGNNGHGRSTVDLRNIYSSFQTAWLHLLFDNLDPIYLRGKGSYVQVAE